MFVKRIRKWFIFFGCLAPFHAALADGVSSIEVLEELTFNEFHDPGYIYFTASDGRKLEAGFYYRLISYEEIEKWGQDEKIELVITQNKGLLIRRKLTSKSFKVVFLGDENPLEKLEKNCLETAMSTLDISGCYHQSSTLWLNEGNYLYRELIKNSSDKLSTRLAETRIRWEEYENSLMESFYFHAQEQGGSIMKIQAASLKSQLAQSHFYQLVSFYE